MPGPPGPPQAAPRPGQGEPEAAPPAPAQGPVPPDKYAGQRFFLVARAPDRPLYVGEPVYVEYLLYTAADLPVADAQVEQAPALKGFVVQQPAGRAPDPRRTSLRGVSYIVSVVWRGAVSALGPGRATLPQVSAIIGVGDGFFVQRRRLASEPVALDFRPVPAEGRPADFVEGTVGQFVIKAAIDKPSVGVGEGAVLTVEVSGTGGLQAVRPPAPQAPAGLRVSRVPASDLDEVVVDVGGVSGKRTFQYLLAPEKPGEYEIGRLDLPFFNPLSGKFERTRTEPLRLLATAGRGGGPVQEVGTDPVIGFIASSDLAAPPEVTSRLLSAQVVFPALAAPVLLFLAIDIAVRRRAWQEQNGASIARRRALRQANAALAALSRQPDTEFWSRLDGVIREFLAARFGLPAGAVTPEDLRGALALAGVGPEAIDALLAQLDNCAFGRFAPSAAQDRDRAASVSRVRECLAVLDRAREAA